MSEYHTVKVDGKLYVPLAHWQAVVADRDRWRKIADYFQGKRQWVHVGVPPNTPWLQDAIDAYERAVRGD